MTLRNKAGLLAAGGIGFAIAAAIRNRRGSRRSTRSFRGRVVAITGGSRGLGLEMARIWADEGARVAICARTDSDLKRAATELRGRGAEVVTVVCDVGKREQAEAFIEHAANAFGRIDVLVNNAGIIQAGPIECMTLDDFEATMATHFWGPLYTIRAALPFLTASGEGRIVNISSIAGEIAVPHMLPYSASKFALTGLSHGLQTELSRFGIAVTTVCPGLMRTGSARNAYFKGRHHAEFAWFSIGDSMPGISMNSRQAARRIVEACRRGRPHLRLTLPAKLGVPLNAAAPSLAGRVLSLVNRILPSPKRPNGETWTGSESASVWSPSILTALGDSAAVRNNEIR